MSFRFRLQRLLELRAEAEQARARTLVDASDHADTTRQTQAAMQSLRELQRDSAEAAAQGAITAGEMQQFNFVLDQLDDRLDRATDDVEEAERLVAEAQAALQEASRDRRVLDRLKERHTERWQEAEVQADRLVMDEVALSRFTQARHTVSNAKTPARDGEDTPEIRHTPSPVTPASPGEHP
jgi:flagellar FliJ protein